MGSLFIGWFKKLRARIRMREGRSRVTQAASDLGYLGFGKGRAPVVQWSGSWVGLLVAVIQLGSQMSLIWMPWQFMSGTHYKGVSGNLRRTKSAPHC